MTPADVRRVAVGALAAALREQKARVRQTREEHGRTSRRAKTAVARLDELREAHEALSAEHLDEVRALWLLRTLVDEIEAEADLSLTLSIARNYLGRSEP